MREGDELDLRTQALDRPYIPIDTIEQKAYIENNLSQIVYPYEQDSEPSIESLASALKEAIKSQRERAERYQISVKSRILVAIDGVNSWVVNDGDPDFGVSLKFTLEAKLLLRILKRRAHWNNAETVVTSIYGEPKYI